MTRPIELFIIAQTDAFVSRSGLRLPREQLCRFSCLLGIAWVQAAIFGLPYIQPMHQFDQASATTRHGFPLWIWYAHFFNFLFLMMLIRSGLSILMDHPRLYFDINNDCTPGTEWIRFTPLTVPKDRVWTAKEDARYISPVFALPDIAIPSEWRVRGTSSMYMSHIPVLSM